MIFFSLQKEALEVLAAMDKAGVKTNAWAVTVKVSALGRGGQVISPYINFFVTAFFTPFDPFTSHQHLCFHSFLFCVATRALILGKGKTKLPFVSSLHILLPPPLFFKFFFLFEKINVLRFFKCLFFLKG